MSLKFKHCIHYLRNSNLFYTIGLSSYRKERVFPQFNNGFTGIFWSTVFDLNQMKYIGCHFNQTIPTLMHLIYTCSYRSVESSSYSEYRKNSYGYMLIFLYMRKGLCSPRVLYFIVMSSCRKDDAGASSTTSEREQRQCILAHVQRCLNCFEEGCAKT